MSIRRSLAWSYGAQVLIFAQSFAVSIVVARLLGPYEMGTYAVGVSTAGLLSVLSSFGVVQYLIRHDAPDASVKATVFTVNAVVNAAVAAIVAGLAIAGAPLGIPDGVRRVLAWLALVPVAAIFEFLPAALAQREMDFRLIAQVAIGRAFVAGALALGFSLNGFGALGPTLGAVGGAVFGALAFNVGGRRHAAFRLSTRGWRALARFGVQMLFIGGLATLVQRSCELILGRVLGLAALGVYSRASSLTYQIWDNVYGLGTRVVFSRMADEMRGTGTVARTYIRGLAVVTATIWPLLIGVAVLSGPLVRLLYGERWHAVAAPLSVLLVGQFVILGFGMNWELCVLRQRTGWQARNEGIRAVVGIAAFAVGSAVGVAAAAAGRVVEALSGLVLFGPRMRELAGTEPGEIATVYRQGARLTLLAVGPSFVLMTVERWSPDAAFAPIATAIAAGAAMWLWGLRRMRHPLAAELSMLIRRIAHRTRGAGTGG